MREWAVGPTPAALTAFRSVSQNLNNTPQPHHHYYSTTMPLSLPPPSPPPLLLLPPPPPHPQPHPPLDLGPMWIHGVDNNPLYEIAEEHGLAMVPTNYENSTYYNHVSAAV